MENTDFGIIKFENYNPTTLIFGHQNFQVTQYIQAKNPYVQCIYFPILLVLSHDVRLKYRANHAWVATMLINYCIQLGRLQHLVVQMATLILWLSSLVSSLLWEVPPCCKDF